MVMVGGLRNGHLGFVFRTENQGSLSQVVKLQCGENQSLGREKKKVDIQDAMDCVYLLQQQFHRLKPNPQCDNIRR